MWFSRFQEQTIKETQYNGVSVLAVDAHISIKFLMLRFINYFSSCFEEINKRVKVKFTEHFVKQIGGQGRMHLHCSLTKLVTPAIT